MSIQETVWGFLKNKGLPEKSAAAVMGNIYAESGFDETLIEAGNSIGLGLCQWSYERRTQLEAYGTDLTHQLNFLWAELSGESSGTGATLQWINKNGYLFHEDFISGNGTVDNLTSAMCFCWERPNVSVAHLDVRQSKANEYFSQFTGTSGTSSGDSANSKSDAITVQATNYQLVANSQKTGDILFGRRYRITVSDDSGNALNVSDLRCTFNIIKTIQMEPNSSEVTIYNLNAKTENAIMVNGKRVTVEAGYEGSQFGLIFDGDILQTIREREDGTTLKLTIIALDSDRAINFEISNFSIARGQTARSIVEHIASQATNPINLGSISEKLVGQTLTRGKTVFGKSSDFLRQIAKSNDLHYYMDDGSLNLISMDDLLDGEIFELNTTTGLVGTPEQTDFGISGQCLLNPQLKLNSLFHVDNSLVRAKKISVSSSSTTPGTTAETSTTATGTTNIRNAIIAEAKKICEDPNVGYKLGARGEVVNGKSYYDCSSFTQHCYSVAGLEINPTSELQWAQIQYKGLKNIDQRAALPGDLVFWFNGDDAYHVAIYGGAGDIYAARTDSKPFLDQVAYGMLYGDYKIGRPEPMIKADGGELPSATIATASSTDSQSLFRSLDKDGIYRIIKITYEGDTRGDSWYLNFESIDQLGGAIATVSN